MIDNLSPPKVMLASSSPYRKSQLATLGIRFDCVSPDIDESALEGESADVLALRLAIQKAGAVANRYHDALIIGSDQTACCEGVLLGKPGNYNRALEQLQWLGGKQVVFYSALALMDTRNQSLQQHVAKTLVSYRKLTVTQMAHYLEMDKPFDCAGSFKSEALGIAILESVESNDPSALIGLPLIALTTMLANAGLDPLARHS